MDSTTYRKGDRVQVSGHGRTASWQRNMVGTVTETRGVRVYVKWDGTLYLEDEMTRIELKKVSHVS